MLFPVTFLLFISVSLGVVITPITNATVYTGTLPPTAYEVFQKSQLYSISIPKETYQTIIYLNRTDSVCGSIAYQIRSMAYPCTTETDDELCSFLARNSFSNPTGVLYTGLYFSANFILNYESPWFLAVYKGDYNDWNSLCSFNFYVITKSCPQGYVTADQYGTSSIQFTLKIKGQGSCIPLVTMQANTFTSITSDPYYGAALLLDIPYDVGTVVLTATLQNGGNYIRGAFGAPANANNFYCSAPSPINNNGLYTYNLTCINPRKGNVYFYIGGAFTGVQQAKAYPMICPDGYGGPNCIDPSTPLNQTSPTTLFTLQCSTTRKVAQYYWIDSVSVRYINFTVRLVNSTNAPTIWISVRQNGYPNFDWTQYLGYQYLFQVVDSDTYRKQLPTDTPGNFASFKIGNGTLYVPTRLYFAVYCESMTNSNIQYTMQYQTIAPITSGFVTTSRVTSGSLTSGSATSGLITTGSATTGLTLPSVTTGEITSGNNNSPITTGDNSSPITTGDNNSPATTGNNQVGVTTEVAQPGSSSENGASSIQIFITLSLLILIVI